MKGPAFIILPLRGLDHVHLSRDVSIKQSQSSQVSPDCELICKATLNLCVL